MSSPTATSMGVWFYKTEEREFLEVEPIPPQLNQAAGDLLHEERDTTRYQLMAVLSDNISKQKTTGNSK
ncbi:Hypothetical predicted protein [Octopus vulgaris]|uniref:Uncharacterized protein n=1 Tax=Octopus vulgaris TaxID=6645 RepID=A0AA36FBN5_OCTVU|nr:Hypothetical predicted protein [Octopus vulgaris]